MSVRINGATTALLAVAMLVVQASPAQILAAVENDSSLRPLKVIHLRVQGLNRAVRFYKPQKLADQPILIVALHGSGGDGERFRHLTANAFEKLADEHGFLVAYPDALGGQWNDCRLRAPYHDALSGIDDAAFIRSVIRHTEKMIKKDIICVFGVGYSNGGHMVFRLAAEMPKDFTALATIAAHLPVSEEMTCRAASKPISIMLVSGTDDPINPWMGGEVRLPDGSFLGKVLSIDATIDYFRNLMEVKTKYWSNLYPDVDSSDGSSVVTYRWLGRKHEIVLMAVYGGGHTLPHPSAPFPFDIVGRTNRDINGAVEIWKFFKDSCSRVDD